MSKWNWLWRRFTKKLWFRTSLFCALAVITALLALVLKDFIPEDVSRKVGAESVDRILQIIASSMLVVTTFTLSTMVAAYSAAATNVTPRSTQVLIEDNTAQNALSVFLGSFLYSLVGIIALSIGVYGESGRLVLFVVTVLVILLIVVVLIRWINYSISLGRVGRTIDMVEKEARKALQARLEHPYLDGVPMDDFKPARHHTPIASDTIGYVQHIDMARLQEIAQEYKTPIYVMALPGALLHHSRPLAYITGQHDHAIVEDITVAFSIGDARSFEQDPRFGLIVLSEIASRALSPAMNDPGTAIDVIGTALRLLSPWVMSSAENSEPEYPDVYVPAVTTAELFRDIFTPIARDGAGIVEVGIRLQKALAALAAVGNSEARREAKYHSSMVLKRAKHGLTEDEDIESLTALLVK